MTRKHSNKSNRTGSAEKTVKDIRRATRKNYGSEEKIRIVPEGCTPSKLMRPFKVFA